MFVPLIMHVYIHPLVLNTRTVYQHYARILLPRYSKLKHVSATYPLVYATNFNHGRFSLASVWFVYGIMWCYVSSASRRCVAAVAWKWSRVGSSCIDFTGGGRPIRVILLNLYSGILGYYAGFEFFERIKVRHVQESKSSN